MRLVVGGKRLRHLEARHLVQMLGFAKLAAGLGGTGIFAIGAAREYLGRGQRPTFRRPGPMPKARELSSTIMGLSSLSKLLNPAACRIAFS